MHQVLAYMKRFRRTVFVLFAALFSVALSTWILHSFDLEIRGSKSLRTPLAVVFFLSVVWFGFLL